MKKVGAYFAVGYAVAILGVLFSDICGSFFNGMEYGSACVLGMGMYLCIVVVTCTGVLASKSDSKSKKDS